MHSGLSALSAMSGLVSTAGGIVLKDNFVGTNGTALTAHTMDVGSGWTQRTADVGMTIQANTAQYADDALDIYTAGPGRETPDYPGWAGEVKPADLIDPHALPAIDGPEWNRFCHQILTALEPFPEARLALAELLKRVSGGPVSGE